MVRFAMQSTKAAAAIVMYAKPLALPLNAVNVACLAKEVVRDTLTQIQTAQASTLPYPVEFTPA